jgi:hypothetical protein
VYTPTTIADPSPRAQALSRDLASLVERRRAQDPGLGVPDALVALELVKASMLEESGVALTGRRAVLVAIVALAVATAGMAFFLMSQ